jgi:hypothetical protein
MTTVKTALLLAVIVSIGVSVAMVLLLPGLPQAAISAGAASAAAAAAVVVIRRRRRCGADPQVRG